MAETINYGIDLGTTNSLIAKFNRGAVEVFKNPNGFKETLPSIVGFRNDRILVGEQAKTYAERDPKSVASRFKRKMGTTETIKIKAINASKSPVELSAFVLKELKSFIRTGETPEAVVITIPASFDTVQSNATKEAGFQAGFKQVILLQEPIAASLAFANKEKADDLKNSQWIVYDLGGGTFDVALIRIVEGELKVIDHEGDNYLGGGDFDAVLIENIIVPELSKLGRFTDLMANLKSDTGKYNRLWVVLLSKAEDAKIELSSRQSAEIDLGTIRDLKDEDGKAIDAVITITRSEFETAIKSFVDATASMVNTILTRNSLRASDVKFVLMVGGSTYTPYVRKRIEEILGIPVNTTIDPTNAIAVGAAYFAATKEAKADKASPTPPMSGLRVRASYSRATQEMEELFSAKIDGDTAGLFYRIVRRDGAYDSSLKRLTNRIVEELPLQPNAFNIFSFRVFDSQNKVVSTDFEVIEIAQGKYSVVGQVLPEDLCLVKDDPVNNDTKLDPIFKKNMIFPAKTKKSVEVDQTVAKGSNDELRIMGSAAPLDAIRRSSVARFTRRATFWSGCPNRCTLRCGASCGKPGKWTTPKGPKRSFAISPAVSNGTGTAFPLRSWKGSTKCSLSRGSASLANCAARSPAPTSSRMSWARCAGSAATSNTGARPRWPCDGPPPPCRKLSRGFRRLKAYKHLPALRAALAKQGQQSPSDEALAQIAEAAQISMRNGPLREFQQTVGHPR